MTRAIAPSLLALLALALPGAAPAATHDAAGTLVERHADRLDGAPSAPEYVIEGPRGAVRPLVDDQPEALVGQRVVLDDADEGTRALEGRVRAAGAQRLAAAPPPGPRSVLVVLVTTADAPSPSATVEGARSAVFTGARSANALFTQQSEGATRLVGRVARDGDVTAPLRLDLTLDGCSEGNVAAAADEAARRAGWVPEAYDHVMYALPSTPKCPWGGLGDVPGRRSWINGPLLVQLTAHELGHNLGAHHAGALACDGPTGPVTLSGTCRLDEYGDPFDVMAVSERLMSSWHRARVGQLPSGQTVEVRRSGTVTLTPAGVFGAAGSRLVVVPRARRGATPTSWYAIEARSDAGPFDLWEPGAPVTSGLSVRIVPALTSVAQTRLLDATPLTASRADAPLAVGQALRDDEHDITLRAESAGAGRLRVAVAMQQLDDDPPTAPGDVAVRGDSRGVVVSWSRASDDDGAVTYEVHRGSEMIGTTPGLSFTDDRVTALPRATYRVWAVDRSGKRTPSAPREIELADVTPPSAVPGLAATAAGDAVVVSWGAAQDNREVRGYRVVRDGIALPEVAGGPLRDRPGPGAHRYEVRAVDAAGNVGPVAVAEVRVAAPEPTPTPTPTPTPEPAPTPGPAPAPGGGVVVTVPSREEPAAPVAAPRALRIVVGVRRWQRTRGGWVLTARVSAAGATSLTAHRGRTRIARARDGRLTLRLRLPRRARRASVRVVAASAAGTTTRTLTLRR